MRPAVGFNATLETSVPWGCDIGEAIIAFDDLPLLVLIVTCHRLQGIGMASPQLWSAVNLTISSLAELFLKRSN